MASNHNHKETAAMRTNPTTIPTYIVISKEMHGIILESLAAYINDWLSHYTTDVEQTFETLTLHTTTQGSLVEIVDLTVGEYSCIIRSLVYNDKSDIADKFEDEVRVSELLF